MTAPAKAPSMAPFSMTFLAAELLEVVAEAAAAVAEEAAEAAALVIEATALEAEAMMPVAEVAALLDTLPDDDTLATEVVLAEATLEVAEPEAVATGGVMVTPAAEQSCVATVSAAEMSEELQVVSMHCDTALMKVWLPQRQAMSVAEHEPVEVELIQLVAQAGVVVAALTETAAAAATRTMEKRMLIIVVLYEKIGGRGYVRGRADN